MPPRAVIYDSVKTANHGQQRLVRSTIALSPGRTPLYRRHLGHDMKERTGEPLVSLEYVAEAGKVILHNDSGDTAFVRIGTASETHRVQPGAIADLIDGSKIIVGPPKESASVLRVIRLDFGRPVP